MSLKQQRRRSKTNLISTKKTCKTGLFQHNNVTTMRPFARSLRTTTLLTNNSQHCWMSCCVRLHNLLHVVAQSLIWNRQTFSDLQTELLDNNVASVCTGLNSSFQEIRITSYSKEKNDILDHLYQRWIATIFISLFYVSNYMKWLIFFIYFHSCHFYHRVYHELTMACSPDGYVWVSLNFFRFFFQPLRAQLFEGRLALNPGFFFLSSKAFSRIIFSVIFGTSNHQLVDKKN